jgi:hypothetical protein
MYVCVCLSNYVYVCVHDSMCARTLSAGVTRAGQTSRKNIMEVMQVQRPPKFDEE